MFARVKHSAAQAARKAGVISAGLLCILVGAGFLTAAAWIYLASAFDSLLAATVIGAVYAGVGLIMLGLASSKTPSAPHAAQDRTASPAAATGDTPPLLQAFLYGMQAGAASDRRSSS